MEQKLVLPLLGSELRNSGKEAVVGILQKTMQIKNKKEGDKIYATEFLETIQLQEKEGRIPSVYKMFPNKCWNGMWEMGDEGLLIVHQKDEIEEAYIIITPTLTKLISSETLAEEKKQILALCQQNKQRAEEAKKQRSEQAKIKKPAPQRVERHQEVRETGIRKYLPKFLKR